MWNSNERLEGKPFGRPRPVTSRSSHEDPDLRWIGLAAEIPFATDEDGLTARSRQAVAAAHDRDGGLGLVARLAALDVATERAAELLAADDLVAALPAWSRIALAAEAIFGREDASVLDAMRIAASVMHRLGRPEDAHRVLCEVAERLLKVEDVDSPRLEGVRREIEATIRDMAEDLRSAG